MQEEVWAMYIVLHGKAITAASPDRTNACTASLHYTIQFFDRFTFVARRGKKHDKYCGIIQDRRGYLRCEIDVQAFSFGA